MSIYSEYKYGYITEDEFRAAGAVENRMEKYYEEHMYDECDEHDDEYEEDEE